MRIKFIEIKRTDAKSKVTYKLKITLQNDKSSEE